MKYRSRADIMAAVLQSMSQGDTTLTRIMYSSFVSYFQVKEYIDLLDKKGLIRHDASSGRYGLSEEGVKILGKLKDLGTLLNTEPPTSSDATPSHVVAETVVRSRKAVDKSEMDSRPIVVYS